MLKTISVDNSHLLCFDADNSFNYKEGLDLQFIATTSDVLDKIALEIYGIWLMHKLGFMYDFCGNKIDTETMNLIIPDYDILEAFKIEFNLNLC